MSKQLTLPERLIIERMLHRDMSFASIGRAMERSASTIAREVLHYRCFTDRIPLPGENDCLKRNHCIKNTLCSRGGFHGCYSYRCKSCSEIDSCTSICDIYESSQCKLLNQPPYVCTKCPSQKTCKKNVMEDILEILLPKLLLISRFLNL